MLSIAKHLHLRIQVAMIVPGSKTGIYSQFYRDCSLSSQLNCKNTLFFLNKEYTREKISYK